MDCGCGNTCQECTPYVIYGKGLKGDAGPAPNITIGITVLPAGEEPTVVPSGVSPNLHYQLGIPAQALPLFSVVANTLAAGLPATASIDNTNPLAPILALGIPRGADGGDGISVFTNLGANFTQPAPGSTVTITVGDTSMLSLGAWIYIAGGGYYIVASNPLSSTQILVRNPSGADLLPYWGVGPTSIPSNAAAGATVGVSGFANQVIVCGPPGLRGIGGAQGLALNAVLVTGVPVGAPAQPEQRLALASDNFANPTWVRFYNWNGASWDPGPNVLGPRGSTIFFESADPNSVSPSGAQSGDAYIRQSGTALQFWARGGSAWSLQSSFALQGSATQTSVQGGPGNFPINLGVFSHKVTADKPIELDWNSTNYAGQGQWTVAIENVDASPIAVTYAAARWERDPAVTLPSSIAAGATAVIRFIQNPVSGLYVITSAYVPASV